MQEMVGMLGGFIIHPKTAYAPHVDKDYLIALQEYAVLPNSTIPNSMSMEFNWLTFNGKAGPASTPLIIRHGERVRVRFINMGMDHHPMHLATDFNNSNNARLFESFLPTNMAEPLMLKSRVTERLCLHRTPRVGKVARASLKGPPRTAKINAQRFTWPLHLKVRAHRHVSFLFGRLKERWRIEDRRSDRLLRVSGAPQAAGFLMREKRHGRVLPPLPGRINDGATKLRELASIPAISPRVRTLRSGWRHGKPREALPSREYSPNAIRIRHRVFEV